MLPDVEAKLRLKHYVTPAQVREAVALGAASNLTWDDDPIYGRRLIATGSDAEGEIDVYLKPLDISDGRWECLTAWRTSD